MSRPRHFPFLAGHDPLRMGVAAIDAREWFELDEDYAAQMAEKERLLTARHSEVFAALPGSDIAAREVLETVSRWAMEMRPDWFARKGDAIRCRDGRAVALAGAHPLETASRLVPEDLCLLQPSPPGAMSLVAASLCFPSRWRLAEKLGRPMPAIHAPVPGLNARLASTIDRFLAGLKAGAVFSRTNWSLTTDPELFQPVVRPYAPISAAEAGERVFYRVERQTLRLMPASGAVLFSIRVHQHKLADFRDDPEMRRALRDAVAGLDLALVAYKSMTAIKDAVLGYLGGGEAQLRSG